MPIVVHAAVAAIEAAVSKPADWALRFQELTAESTQSYARNLRRYHDLLQRVARGELQPDSVQRQYRDYFQERAADSTREMVELSVGLLAGLLHTEATYRDHLLDGMLPPAGATPPPPLPAGVDINNWFQALAAYTTEQSTRAVRRQQQLVERIASGEVTAARVQEQGQKFLETQSGEFLGDVIGLGLRFVAQMHRSSAALTDGLYNRVLGPEPSAGAAPEPPLCVDLRGSLGSVASACIVVENTRSSAADVTCRASGFVARSGGMRVDAPLEITPSRFTLAPGGQHEVDLRLLLDSGQFTASADYAASLVVSGAGDRDLIVPVIAHAS
jgi:hypothetical protein